MLSLDNLVVVLAEGPSAQPAWAAALAWQAATGAKIHVFLPLSGATPRGLELAPGLRVMAEQGNEHEGERWLQGWLHDVPPGTTYTVTTTGKWCDAVLHEARRQDAGLLIVSGAIGSKELHPLLRQLPCPLYLARRSQRPRRLAGAVSAVAEDTLHKLLNEVVLEHLAKLAGLWQAEALLLSAFPNPADLVPLMGDTYAVGYVDDEIERGYRARVIAQASPLGLGKATLLARLGRPDLTIPLLAQEAEIDCLLLGTVTRQALASFWLGNTAEELLLRIDCDALVLRPQDYYDPR